MSRLRYDSFFGTITNNPLTIGGVTLTSAELATFPVVTAPGYTVVILDPEKDAGEPEIVWITAHSSNSTSATILRGQEGSMARQHLQDTIWSHGPTAQDFITSYVHVQSSPQATWTVVHSLGYRPGVSVVDSADNLVIGNITYVDDNQLTIAFSSAFAGRAYLS
jgi:hypothetical protein